MKRQTYVEIENDLAPFEGDLDAGCLERWLDQRRPCTFSIVCIGERGMIVQLSFAHAGQHYQRAALPDGLVRAVRDCIKAREEAEAVTRRRDERCSD